MFTKAITSALFLSSAAAFSAPKNEAPVANKIAANVVGAGLLAATVLTPQGPAMAADSLVIGTPLETKLAKFGEVSYPVFNSIGDLTPLADKFIDLIDKNVKPADAADVAQKGVDGLLAIPDSAINEYKGILKQVVYSGVSKDSCVTLNGWDTTAQKFKNSAAIKSVDPAKIDKLGKKFAPANNMVPIKNGNICLPGSVAASEKLWVAQAELTFSMPKEEASALVAAIKTAGKQATRPKIATIVKDAESVFSKSPEAIKMVAAGKDVEPTVISTANAALK